MNSYNDNEEPGFFQRNRTVIGAGIVVFVVAVFGIAVFFALSIHSTPPRKPQEIVVHLEPPPPLPPPPPPPPPKTPPPEPKMVEQPPVKPNEQKPKDEPKVDHPPSQPGPVANGPPSNDGIGGSRGGDGNIGGDENRGSRWGWYAGKIQEAIAEAVRRNDKTRDASLRIKVRVWADTTGRITQASLTDSSGDPSIDSILKNQVLTGLTLPEPPPSDMPMPIVLRINAQRPH